MFFIYPFDIYNLAIKGLEMKMADPREDLRWENIEIVDQVLYEPPEDIISTLENLKINPNFTCSNCG